MTCLSEMQCHLYIEEEMTGDEIRLVQNHLQQCTPCREKLARLQVERRTIKQSLTFTEDTPDLEAAISTRLKADRETRGRQNRLRFPMWPIAAAAVLVAAVSFTFLVWLQPDRPQPSAEEKEILVCSAQVGGIQAESYIYHTNDPNTQYIWFEKKEVSDNE